MKAREAHEIIQKIEEWVTTQPSISGALLVGSYARGNPRPDSDIDICLITSNVNGFIQDPNWITSFGTPEKAELEDWGALKSVRVFYATGAEVEFGFAELSWAATSPMDPGTFDVIYGGARILYDPKGFLEDLLNAVSAEAANR